LVNQVIRSVDMDKYLLVKVYEDEYSDYGIAFMAIPLTQEFVGQLASRFASCEPAFGLGAKQVRFFDACVGVVDLWATTVDPSSNKWYAVERMSEWLEYYVRGMVVYLSKESQELLRYYHVQVLAIHSDGDIKLHIAPKNGLWADSAPVPLAYLCELVGIEVPEALVPPEES
jgi:hypothetical protein